MKINTLIKLVSLHALSALHLSGWKHIKFLRITDLSFSIPSFFMKGFTLIFVHVGKYYDTFGSNYASAGTIKTLGDNFP